MEIGALVLISISPYTAYLPALYMIYKLFTNFNLRKISVWDICVFILFVWSFITGLLNKDTFSAAAAFVLLLYLALCVYIENTYTAKHKIDKLIKSVVAVSVFASLIGILEKILSVFIDMDWWTSLYWNATYVPDAESYRVFSTFGNPNTAGTWFAAMVLACFYLFENAAEKKEKRIYAAEMGIIIVALFFTGSYGAIFGLQLGLWIYYFLKPRKNRGILLALIFTTLLIFLYISLQINHPINSRREIWEKCLNLFELKPLTGWGLLGILKQTQIPHAHNIYINIAATLGIVGLIVYAIMRFATVFNLYELYQKNSRFAPLLAAVQAMIIGQGLVDFTVLTPQAGILFFGSNSLINALASNSLERSLYALNLLLGKKHKKIKPVL